MLNNIAIQGRLVRDPEFLTKGDNLIVSLVIANKRNFKNKQGEYATNFISVLSWNNQVVSYIQSINLTKGDLVTVVGEIFVNSHRTETGYQENFRIQANSLYLDSRSKSNIPVNNDPTSNEEQHPNSKPVVDQQSQDSAEPEPQDFDSSPQVQHEQEESQTVTAYPFSNVEEVGTNDTNESIEQNNTPEETATFDPYQF